MAANLTSPRPDITYIKRRLKPGEQASAAPVKKVSLRLNLDAPGEEYDNSLPKKPQADGRVVLTLEAPVVRLNARQSAIGSLTVSEAEVFGWQDKQHHSGIVSRVNNTPQMHEVPVNANRKLAEFYEGKFVLGLRHIHQLRRLVIGGHDGILRLNLLDGTEISADTDGGKRALYLSVIGNEIEVRVEKLYGTIDETFSITSPVAH
jgi:hypothetical protein